MESATFEPGMFEWEKCIVCGNRFEDHPLNENGSYDCPNDKWVIPSGHEVDLHIHTEVQNENMQG